jgi:Fe2+ transport system protein FeoA
LTALRPGEVAVVVEIVGDSGFVNHLREVGFCVGVEVEMIQSGGACIVRLDGQKLCLRSDELASVLVTPRDANA